MYQSYVYLCINPMLHTYLFTFFQYLQEQSSFSFCFNNFFLFISQRKNEKKLNDVKKKKINCSETKDEMR